MRPGFDSWIRNIPWRRKWEPTPIFLPGESPGLKSLAGYSPWSRNSQTRNSQTKSPPPPKIHWIKGSTDTTEKKTTEPGNIAIKAIQSRTERKTTKKPKMVLRCEKTPKLVKHRNWERQEQEKY